MMEGILVHIFGIIDASVELYLSSVIAPFLVFHEKFYTELNRFLRKTIDDKGPLPAWCTANFITYFRTVFVFPSLFLMSMGWRFLPALIVLLVDFGDFLDGVVARYWVEMKSAKTTPKEEEETEDTAIEKKTSNEDGYHVVSTGSPQVITSWVISRRQQAYGGFIDAICDKAFLIPCWILLLSMIPGTRMSIVQYVVLFSLITAEIASGCVRFRAYFTNGGAATPVVEDIDFSSSAIKADHVGKAKQTFEMVGTTLFLVPFMRLPGLLFLIAATPLAYESVRRKIKKRVMYVDGTVEKFDHSVVKFWMQSKSLGSKLIVGISGESGKPASDLVLNACSCSSVDAVVAEAPDVITNTFMSKHGIDYVVCPAGKQGIVHDDIVESSQCIIIEDDGVAHPAKAKSPLKTE